MQDVRGEPIPLTEAFEGPGVPAFDTELLLLAEHNGLRVQEIPVDWIDDADSRVHVTRTAVDDPRGTARMVRTFASGGGTLELGAAARPPLDDDFGRRIVSFAAIGTVSTVVSLLLYLLTWNALGAVGANVLAVSATFLANTWANARFTIGIRRARWRAAVATYVGSLALTSAALLLVVIAGGGFGLQLATLVITWLAIAGFRLRSALAPPTPS